MKNIYLIVILVIFQSSCESYFFEEDMASISPKENFDYLWKQCDEKYAYFDLKGIDWDRVYTEYAAKLSDDMSKDSLFKVLGGMLTELKDDHTNLISAFNISFFGVDNLGQDNFDWRIIRDNYLPRDYYISGPFRHDFIADNRVGYVRFPSFTGQISGDNLDFVLDRYKNAEGIILDLRENGGGAVSDVFNLLSRFVQKKTLTHYSRIKSGPGHDEFSSDEAAYVSPKGKFYGKKVIMLIDRGTYSAGSFTAIATKAIPNIILMGDTTGGGLGLPNGGQLPNGWTYRFSITQTLSVDKDASYENGVPPDIPAFFDWSDLNTDEVIERALLEIL